MAESIRDRQNQLTQDAVVLALAEHVAQTQSFDFTIAEIAARAGVSPRTVYNHFGDRQGLIEALAEHAGKEMDRHGGTDLPSTLHALPGLVDVNFRAMEAVPELAEAFSRLDAASHPSRGRTRRTELILDLIQDACPDLEQRHSATIAVMVHQMASSSMWYLLTRERGLTTEDAATVCAWTMRLQVEALDSGDLPRFLPPESDDSRDRFSPSADRARMDA